MQKGAPVCCFPFLLAELKETSIVWSCPMIVLPAEDGDKEELHEL